MSTDTLSKNIGTWKAQIANVKARLPEMPQLVETVQDFEALVLEGEELQSAQDVYRSKLRETTLRSKDILRRGRSFRNRLIAGAQSVFGVESPLLLEVGAKPRLPKRLHPAGSSRRGSPIRRSSSRPWRRRPKPRRRRSRVDPADLEVALFPRGRVRSPPGFSVRIGAAGMSENHGVGGAIPVLGGHATHSSTAT